MTEKIYAKDGMTRTFSAVVRSSDGGEDGFFRILLDRTAFFPGGGGQAADEGILVFDEEKIPVLGMEEAEGEVFHLTAYPIPVGSAVRGEVDFSVRLPRMQNHTGEHILCGIIHSRWGYDNVGFHLGSDGVTVDLSGELSWEALLWAEAEANRVITECHQVTVSFPSPDELPTLSYRSKLELTENVRLVTVEGCDVCACCAPHVSNTGEIGLLKIQDMMRYKGGVRLHILCGQDALRDYEARRREEAELSALLTSPRCELADALRRRSSETDRLRMELREARRALMRARAEAEAEVTGDLLFIDPTADEESLRTYANLAAKKCRLAVAVSGNPGAYRYIIVSEKVDLKKEAPLINGALKGRGGGRGTMISGTFAATEEEIRAYFRKDGNEKVK